MPDQFPPRHLRRGVAAGLFAVTALLAACGENDFERAATGAATGGVAAAVTGGNLAQGAVVGGAAGALCDDVGLCN